MTSISSELTKATLRGERARIEALTATLEARVRRAFRQFLDAVRSNVVRRQVRLALESGDVQAALKIVDSHVVLLGGVVNNVFLAASEAEVRALARRMGGARAAVALSFDPAYPRAAQIMQANQLEFVRQFSLAQRESTEAALTEALKTGAGPVQVARAFRDSIGLTDTQRRAVDKYRSLLEAGDAAALERGLRDRRFDPSVARAVETGEPLGAARINRMVERYHARYLQYRAETIARTETLSVLNQARQETLRQVSAQLDLPSVGVRRTWRATQDARTRDTHAAMDGQSRLLGEPFESPSGAQFMHPGDRSLGAGVDEVINCRCVLLVDVSVD